ncbi:hypothetical protein Tco_0688616 [Tanacetum coccineum]
MLAPKCPTFNGRPTFANPMYLKKAQNEIPCLYAIPHDQSDPANRLVPDREETLTLDNESRSKLNKDLVKPFDYTKLNNTNDSFAFVHELKQEMHADLKYVESLEDEIDELESDKAEIFPTKVNARHKEYPTVVPISTRKPKSQANKSVATYRKKTVASESTTTNPRVTIGCYMRKQVMLGTV